MRLSLKALRLYRKEYYLPQRRLRTRHSKQPCRCDALVSETQKEHGCLPGGCQAGAGKGENTGMTPSVFNEYLTAWQDKYNPLYKTLDDVPPYWWEDAAALVRAGAVKGDGINSFGLRRSELKVAIVSKRYADFLLSKGNLRAGRQSRDSKDSV